MRVNETDNDQVICANIQNKIKAGHGLHNSSDSIFFLTFLQQNTKKVLLIYVPLVRAVTYASIRPTKNGLLWWSRSEVKKQLLYH